MIPLLIFKDEARDDVLKAAEWYGEKQTGLNEKFLTAIEEAIERILKHPTDGRIVYKSYREIPVKKFPYLIVYEIFLHSIVIYMIFHTRQNPKKKFKRLKK